ASRPRSASAGRARSRCRAPARACAVPAAPRSAPRRAPASGRAFRVAGQGRRRAWDNSARLTALPSLPPPPWHGPVRPSSTMRAFTLSDFDFDLPPDLVAQHPAPERSASRLLDATAEPPADRVFRDLPQRLRAGDLL